MSAEKKAQLIAEGKLNPDGTMPVVCPTCQRPFAEGEEIPPGVLAPTGEGDAVAEAEAIVADAATPEV